MSRAATIAVLGLVAGLSACSKPAPKGPAKRVLLFSCDTLRADRLGCYGNTRSLTPNLDRLAAESAVFTNAWSHAPLTGPSLSALLSGRFPDEVGASPTNRELMPTEVETLAEIASAHGIDTAAFVSNGVLRRPPAKEGRIGVQQGFALFDDTMNSKETNRDLVERTGDACSDAVLAWLAKKTPEDPFFLWVHWQDPHGPYTPPPEHLARTSRGDHADQAALPVGTNHSGERQLPKYQLYGDERRPGQYEDRYDAEVAFFDAQIGRVLDSLRERGMLDDALVVFTADHGESLGEHEFWFCHGEHLHRELVNVPFLVKPPKADARRASGTTDELAMHVDFAPTMLEAFGITDAEAGRGSSLLAPRLPDGRVAPQFLGPLLNPGRRLAVTDGRWRVLKIREAPDLLFDLALDPGETRDVAAQNPEVLRALGQRYLEFMKEDARPWSKPARPKFDAPMLRAMQGLGYTDGEDPNDPHGH